MHESLGDKLLALCASAKKDVFLAAPFLKLGAMKRICSVIPDGIPLTVVGRFSADDLRAGVSDLAVVDLLADRGKTTFFVHPTLHAKIYRVDEQALIGSANITFKGLGWSSIPNIEILINASSHDSIVGGTEEIIRTQAFPLSHDMYKMLEQTAKPSQEEKEELESNTAIWVPHCRRPEFLMVIHQTGNSSQCTDDVVENAKYDLAVLQVPSGLSKEDFIKWLNVLFCSTPIYKMLVEQCKQSERFNDDNAVEWLNKLLQDDALTPQDAWSNIKAWLRFLKSDLMVVTAGEAVILAKPI